MKRCAFCEILDGSTRAWEVFRDEHALAFLDHRPLFPGHCLVVPTEHHETLTDLPTEAIDPFFRRVRRITEAVESAMEAGGSFVAMNNRISQSVPHLHVHVVPRNRKDGLRGFFWPRHPYADEEEIRSVQTRLRAALQ